MAIETPKNIDNDPLNVFLRENYSYKPESVDETIKFAEEHKGDLSLQAYLMVQIGLFVKERGIESIPVMLAAVQKIEKDLPPEEKRLNARDYVGLLMTAETTSAKKEAEETRSVNDAYDHGERAKILYDFWIELQ
jgi:hypothetical protein